MIKNCDQPFLEQPPKTAFYVPCGSDLSRLFGFTRLPIPLKTARNLHASLSEPSARCRLPSVASLLAAAILAGDAPTARGPAPCKSPLHSPLSDRNYPWPGIAVCGEWSCPDRTGLHRLAHRCRSCAFR